MEVAAGIIRFVVANRCCLTSNIFYCCIYFVDSFKYRKTAVKRRVCTKADRTRLNAVLRRYRRLGYPDDTDAVCVDELFQSGDDKLFAKILHNSAHFLQPMIPDRSPSSYDLRPRTHDKLLLDKTTLMIGNLSYACSISSFFTHCYLLFIFFICKLRLSAFN